MKARWLHTVESAKDEALNAVEFYNRPGSRRPLEAFLVHMHIAWLYLLQAQFERDGVSNFYRDSKNKRRYVRVDGEKKAWDLERSVRERWPASNNPTRKNLELTVRLRNKIEHRFEPGLFVTSAGFCQALIINFEEELVRAFGREQSISDLVHIPVTLGTFTREGVAKMMAAQQDLPKRLQDFFIDYRASLGEDVVNDRHFEFRVDVIQRRSPKSEADLAVTFVREDDLSEEERQAYEALAKTGRVIIRDKDRSVANLENLRPKAAALLVERAIPFRFRASSEFPVAWKALAVRPDSSAKGDARKKTNQAYCFFDAAHNDYVYTPAFVDLLIERCSSEEGFEQLIGRPPAQK